MDRPSYTRLAQHSSSHPGRGHRPLRQRQAGLLTTYCLCLACLVATALISPAVTPVAYVALGICISRSSGRNITWSDHHATIHNVCRAKLAMIVTWPIALPRLLLAIWVSKAC